MILWDLFLSNVADPKYMLSQTFLCVYKFCFTASYSSNCGKCWNYPINKISRVRPIAPIHVTRGEIYWKRMGMGDCCWAEWIFTVGSQIDIFNNRNEIFITRMHVETLLTRMAFQRNISEQFKTSSWKPVDCTFTKKNPKLTNFEILRSFHSERYQSRSGNWSKMRPTKFLSL